MLLSIQPLTCVFPAIWPGVRPMAALKIPLVAALIARADWPLHLAIAINFTVQPLPSEHSAIQEQVHSTSMHLVILELAFVDLSSSRSVSALPMLRAACKFTLIA